MTLRKVAGLPRYLRNLLKTPAGRQRVYNYLQVTNPAYPSHSVYKSLLGPPDRRYAFLTPENSIGDVDPIRLRLRDKVRSHIASRRAPNRKTFNSMYEPKGKRRNVLRESDSFPMPDIDSYERARLGRINHRFERGVKKIRGRKDHRDTVAATREALRNRLAARQRM